MEVNRRTGIGAMLSGLFMAPEVAKEVAKNSASMTDVVKSRVAAYETGQVAMPSPADIAAKEESEVKYLRKRIKRLQRAIKGDFSQEDDDWANDYSEPEMYRHNRIDGDVDCLKSVSTTVKYLIKNKRYYLRDVESQKDRAKRDLEHLIKKQIRDKLRSRFSDLFK